MQTRTLALSIALWLSLAGAASAADPDPAAVIAALTGSATSKAGPLKIGSGVATGDEITVLSGEAVIAFSDGSKVRLSQGSTIAVAEKSSLQTSLTLVRGKLDAWVKRGLSRRFRIRSGTAVASVRGTIFSVGFINGVSSFMLFRGSLGVGDALGRNLILSPGQQLSANVQGLGEVGALPPGFVIPAEPPVEFVPPVESQGAPPKKEEKKAEEPAEESLPAPEGSKTTTSPKQETSTGSGESGESTVVSPSSPPA